MALLYILYILLALLALTLAVSFGVMYYNTRRRPARDLTAAPLDGTRFCKYGGAVRSGVLGFRALGWEDVRIAAFDGVELRGRALRGGTRCALLLHGYHSSAENDFAGIAQWYASRGYTVLAPDERAHGLSGGSTVTFGVKERRDAVAWAEFAEAELGADEVWVHGVSMGAASALLAMGERDGYPASVRGVIADCPFDTLRGLFGFYVRTRAHLPEHPVAEIGSLAWIPFFGPRCLRESCHAAAARSTLPLLLFAAGRDTTVPPGSAEAVRRARGGRDRLIFMPEARHALCWQEDPAAYAAALDEFISVTQKAPAGV